MYTFPQIIINKAGHSYLAEAGNYISHKGLQDYLKEIMSLGKKDVYYVFEVVGSEAILRAVQKNVDMAIKYFNLGDNSNRLIAHTNNVFINRPSGTKNQAQ